MKKGFFISFEGVDGCGKSTQLRFLAEKLTGLGLDVLTTREPGGSPIAEKIREILLDPENKGLSAYAEAHLYSAARAQHIDEVLLPALAEGKIILCDRYIDSSVAYQGGARGISARKVLAINEYALKHCMPDMTLFLDYPPEKAFARMNPNKKHDRLEQEGEEFFSAVYDGFLNAVHIFPERITIIKPLGSKYQTSEIVSELVLARLCKEGIL